MELEKIEIVLTDVATTTSGINIPAGLLIVIEENKQAFSTENNYHIFPDFYYNTECRDNGKSTLRVEGLHEVVNLDEYGISAENEVQLKIPTTGEADVDTLAKKKALIIAELASKLGKAINVFE